MKKALIKRIQKWTVTATSLAFDNIVWKIQDVIDILENMNESNRFQSLKLNLNTQTALYNRWLNKPDIIFDRMELGYWLNFKGLLGVGVEVGVCKGYYSRILLDSWKGRLLHSVDPWKSFEQSSYVDLYNLSDIEHDKNYHITKNKLKPYGTRSSVIRDTSQDASSNFKDESLDFVYIDAQHQYDAVVQDISLWYPKVRPGGIICGHDYLDGRINNSDYGVKSAVDEFIKKNKLLLIVTRTDQYPSWFAEKIG